MTTRIEVTDYQCNLTNFDLDEFVTAQTIDGMGNILGLDEGRMLDEEIGRLRNLAVGESMPLGEAEAGLTLVRWTKKEGGDCPWWGKDGPDAARPQGCWFPDCQDEPHA